MNFLITPAYAQAAGSPGGADFVMQMAPFAIILVIMYFLILRPQQKRAKSHAEMIANVRRGDTVVTSGGFVARVTKVTDDPEIEAMRDAWMESTNETELSRLNQRIQARAFELVEPLFGEGAVLRHRREVERGA